MWRLIIAYTDSETWHTSQHHTWEAAVGARNRGLKAERQANLRDQVQGRPINRKQVAWTAVVSERQSYQTR